MKKRLPFLTLVLLSAMLLSACTHPGQPPSDGEESEDQAKIREEKMQTTLTLKSSVFEEGKPIPKRYTCDGQNSSPPLSMEGIPEGTQSVALIVDDPDAPMGTWVHWVVWNMPPQFDEIPEGSVPPSALHFYNFRCKCCFSCFIGRGMEKK